MNRVFCCDCEDFVTAAELSWSLGTREPDGVGISIKCCGYCCCWGNWMERVQCVAVSLPNVDPW